MSGRTQVLEMLANGKITAEQGAQLLAALPPEGDDRPAPAPARAEGSNGRGTPRWVHVRVSDAATGHARVNVNVPLGIVRFGLRLGARFSPEVAQIDPEEVVQMLHQAVNGPLVDVRDEDNGERVEVFVD